MSATDGPGGAEDVRDQNPHNRGRLFRQLTGAPASVDGRRGAARRALQFSLHLGLFLLQALDQLGNGLGQLLVEARDRRTADPTTGPATRP